MLKVAKSEAVKIQKRGSRVSVILDATRYEKLLDYIENLEDNLTVFGYENDPESFGKSTPREDVVRELDLRPLRN